MDFERHMPQLFCLVENIKLSALDGLEEGASALDRLKIITDAVGVIFSDHGLYGAKLVNVINQMERYRTDEASNHMNSNQRKHIRRPEVQEPNKIHEAFVEHIRLFVRLSDSLDKAKSLVEKVREHRQLKRASISLPPEESDRFARYQASLERRLSSQIGELRVMQADKLRPN
jgi:hypothetical protein